MPRDDSQPASTDDDLADAHHSIQYTTGWINNADTKGGLLAAAAVVVLAALVQQLDLIRDVLEPARGREWVALILLVAVLAATLVAVVALAAAVVPRTPPAQQASRFGFPTLADPSWVREHAGRDVVAREAWAQATVLARIADRKYAALRVAGAAVFLSVIFFVGWLIAAAFVSQPIVEVP